MDSFRLSNFIDLNQKSLYITLVLIALNPFWWNIVARNEYRNKTITRILGGNARLGCYLLTITIFTLGIVRDIFFERALRVQPTMSFFPPPFNFLVPTAVIIVGQVLVLSSAWALGITGTFLGDYFGILMEKRVEGFPFNIIENPMYTGTTLSFIGGSLWVEKPAGLLMSLFIILCYIIALRFEGPFTTMIYSNKAKSSTKKKL